MKFGTSRPGTAREGALAVAERHVESEYTNDIEKILPTVSSKDCFFPIVIRLPDGTFVIEVYEGTSGARDFYTRRATELHLEGSDNLSLMVGDWYTVRHSVGTITCKEGLGVERAGKLAKSPTVIVFPIAEDGIVGELPWAKHDLDTCIAMTADGSTMPDVNEDPVAAATLISDYVDAWQNRSRGRLDELYAESCFRVAHSVDAGHANGRTIRQTVREDILGSLAAGPGGELSVISQHVTSWYGVVEYSIGTGEGRYRLIAVYAIENGHILGETSYAMKY
jgi:hypothetical protein